MKSIDQLAKDIVEAIFQRAEEDGALHKDSAIGAARKVLLSGFDDGLVLHKDAAALPTYVVRGKSPAQMALPDVRIIESYGSIEVGSPRDKRIVHAGGAAQPISFDWPKSKDENRNFAVGLLKAMALGFEPPNLRKQQAESAKVRQYPGFPPHGDKHTYATVNGMTVRTHPDRPAEKWDNTNKRWVTIEPGALPQLDD